MIFHLEAIKDPDISLFMEPARFYKKCFVLPHLPLPGSSDVSGMVAQMYYNVLQLFFVLLRTAAVARFTESTKDHSIHSNGSSAADGEVLRGFSSDSYGNTRKPTENGQSFTSQQWWQLN